MLFMDGTTTTTSTTISGFVNSIISAITSNITIADIGTVVAVIVGAGIFAWKMARKGFAFIRNSLSGKAGKL
jgi:hypothetical protein